MIKPLLLTAAAAALLGSPVGAKNATPPGTCSYSYPKTGIPGDPTHAVSGVIMTIDPGRTGNWHKHDAVEYITITSGRGALELDGRPSIALAVGKTVMIPTGVEHAARNLSKTSPLIWSGIFVGPNTKRLLLRLTKGETARTPGCPEQP
ncbi:MAG TPA: cupin domain-containing protein [Candidatus Baltobacteraceae bacterium]